MANAPYRPQPQPSPQKKSRLGLWLIIGGVVLLLLVAVGGIVAALAISGARKYIANSKEAEARFGVGQMAKDAVAAYARDGRLCPSASSPVPATVPRGTKYQSSMDEWQADKAAHAGFACLHFELDEPQYYQYDYKATPTSFAVIARGDLNGNGVQSRFELDGHVSGGKVIVSPTIKVTNPEE